MMTVNPRDSIKGKYLADVRFTPESGHSRLRLFALAYDFNRALGLHAVHQSSDRLCLYFRYFRGNTISSAAIDG